MSVFYLTAALAPLHPDNAHTFVTSHFEAAQYGELRQEWRPRVLSVGAADIVAETLWDLGVRRPQLHLRVTVGFYSALWLLLVNAVLLWGFRRRAVVLMWGVFAAVVFGYCPGVVTRVYPWDLPALFFFSAFLACYHRGIYRALPPIVLVGLLFKETTAVLCLAFLFLDLPMKERLRYAVVTAALFVAVKAAVDVAVHNPVPLLSMTSRAPGDGGLRFVENMRIIGSASLAHPVFINAGTLFALAVLPGKGRAVWMARCVAAAFALNTVFFAMIDEYRIWLELAPFAVYVLGARFLDGGPAAEAPRDRTAQSSAD